MLAIIGGTGLTSLQDLEITRREVVHTPYGEPSGPVIHGVLFGKPISFLARHGNSHTIPPHMINYRANLWALKHIGVERVVAFAAVGGIDSRAEPGRILIPDQIIDYTWGREHTFFATGLDHVTHVDFTQPYCQALRGLLIKATGDAEVAFVEGGTYGATQGPRLETAAEINRLEQDGCDMVGMTGMPEAALARELGLSYATCAISVNWAAGRSEGAITMDDIKAALEVGMGDGRELLRALMPLLD